MIFEVNTEKKTVIFKSSCKVQDLYDIIVEYQLQDFTVSFDIRTQTYYPYTNLPWESTPNIVFGDSTATVKCRGFSTSGDSPIQGTTIK